MPGHSVATREREQVQFGGTARRRAPARHRREAAVGVGLRTNWSCPHFLGWAVNHTVGRRMPKHALGFLPIAPAVAPHERVGRDAPFGQPDPHDLGSGRTELSAGGRANVPGGLRGQRIGRGTYGCLIRRTSSRHTRRVVRRRRHARRHRRMRRCSGELGRTRSSPGAVSSRLLLRRCSGELGRARSSPGAVSSRLLLRRCSRELGRVLSRGFASWLRRPDKYPSDPPETPSRSVYARSDNRNVYPCSAIIPRKGYAIYREAPRQK